MLSRLPRGLPVRSSSRTDRPLTGDPYDPRATSSALGLRFRSPFPCGFPFGPFRRCSRLVVLRRPLGALLSKPVARLGGWIAFPRDPTGAAPHVVHSCEEPGELGHLPSCLTARRPLSPCSLRARRAGDASGRPACCAGTTGYAWGASRRRPRSIRPMSAAHRFCSQRTFRDAAQVSMHATAHFPTRWGSSRFTP